MLSGDNRAEIIVNHNGYVFSSSVRGASGEVQDYILSQEDYVVSEDGTFMYKSRLTPAMLSVTDRSTGKKKKVRINENRIVFWSKKYQERARYERQKAIEKALKYGTAENRHGGNKYVKKTVVNKANGELIDNKEYLTELDLELIEQDEALDGFYMICSNVVGLDSRLGEKPFEKDFRFIEQDNCFQLNKEVNPLDIVDMYRELWQIEESFRIIKSLLKARPVFVHKDDSIRAHFLVCFVSLLILRILQKKKCGNTIEVGRMVESLQKASLVNIGDDIYASSYCDNIIEKLGSSLNLDLTRKKYNRQQLLKMLAQTRKS
jgi:transposase